MGILAGWQYCPRCGSPLAHTEGRVACDACGFVHYAGSAPAANCAPITNTAHDKKEHKRAVKSVWKDIAASPN